MCAKIHGKRGEETPCDECTPPLLPENADAVVIWSIVQDQVILAPMGGPVAVNQLAIHEAMALYGVAKTSGTASRKYFCFPGSL